LTIETYYRFCLQDILPGYKKILYLDCDIVVKRDIAELFDTDIDGYLLAATVDADLNGLYNMYKDDKIYFDTVLRLEHGITSYFQAGVLVFNLDEFRKKLPSEVLFKTAMSYHWKFHDQDVLNHLCNGNVKYIDTAWDVLYEAFDRAKKVGEHAPIDIAKAYFDAKKSPYIIHYAGYPKPWDDETCEYGDVFWKYARQSPYYEQLFHELNYKKIYALISQEKSQRVMHRKINMKGLLKKLINKILPIGSRRRNFVKKLLGRKTKRNRKG
jgi:lipopolysaccharide biosynthesis glycosyltransferase